MPFFVLGGGSNILFGDRGFDGIVVRLAGDMSGYRFEGSVLHVGAGAHVPALVKESAERGLSGLECLAGVPGTIGGALVGNAGTRDEWIGEAVASVNVALESGQIVPLDRRELSFSYRTSNLAGRPVTGAVLNLKKGSKNDILNKLKERMLRRTQRQPAGTWNAGSVFRNPPDDSAGRLIEACGLKGLAFGGAQVSEKHANFIVNAGSATAADVRSLVALVRQKVKEKFQVELTLEIKIVGE